MHVLQIPRIVIKKVFVMICVLINNAGRISKIKKSTLAHIFAYISESVEEPRTKRGLSHKILRIELVSVSATGLQFLPSL